MPTVEIDGRKIEVPDGTTVMQAAERLAIEIPHYCWHPGLSIAGNCRMCLVDIEKSPKLQIACNTRVMDGMVVSTTSEKTRVAQKAVLELLLVNHPIDCPVCDQAGECKLQEYYMDYDRQRSRIALPDKVRKKKAKPIGPLVMLDQERCVLCSRCVRFCDEVTHTSELGFYSRGNHTELDVAPGKTLDNPYSGNVVDVCPVGALTSRDFRFRARVWYLERSDSVCGACANGCNMHVYQREDRIYRFQPRENQAVNQYWMCDAGRLSYHALQGEGRLGQALWRTGEGFEPAPFAAAVRVVAGKLQDLATEHGAESIGILASAQATNEELHLLRQLATRLGARLAGIAWSPPGAFHDDFLIKADKNPNTRGLVLQGIATNGASDDLLRAAAEGRLQALVLHRCDLTAWKGDAARAALERVPYLVVLDTDRREATQFASVVLPIGTYVEVDGTFTNHAGRVQRFLRAVAPPGEARPGWQVLAQLLAALTGGTPVESAAAVFDALATEHAAFRGLSWQALGEGGQPAGTGVDSPSGTLA
jgi:NADH-quinone oxidoreductase subunit G